MMFILKSLFDNLLFKVNNNNYKEPQLICGSFFINNSLRIIIFEFLLFTIHVF